MKVIKAINIIVNNKAKAVNANVNGRAMTGEGHRD